jgi:hypothetical protein
MQSLTRASADREVVEREFDEVRLHCYSLNDFNIAS